MNIYYWIYNDYQDKKLYQYSGGTLVVAAESEEQAKSFALEKEKDLFISSYPTCNIDLIYKLDKATIDREKPEILIHEGYVE